MTYLQILGDGYGFLVVTTSKSDQAMRAGATGVGGDDLWGQRGGGVGAAMAAGDASAGSGRWAKVAGAGV
ncbi:hypothetical protein E2562_027371 [Oryza meyeriana var. granulata]|uniref:Uncharacterized protein n=1 Tax=Oryza meyeriana var. granulata TaxID=110450 RepID=A0A6G1EQ95_9ORYZ|nr:hypothetical protein E2562_027371 [Oryza meyeriana var. granulata]